MANRRIVEVLALPPQYFKINVTEPGGSTPKEIAAQRSSIMGWSNWGTIGSDEVKTYYEAMKTPLSRSLPVDNRTEIGLYQLNGTYKNFFPGTYYLFEDQIKNTSYSISLTGNEPKAGNIISDMIECGLSNCILNYWEIPEEYIEANSIIDPTNYNPEDPSPTGIISVIKGSLKSSSIVYTPYSSYAQGVINNKARYGQSVTVKVYNPASGASLTKHIYDALPESALPGTAQYSLPYRVAADIRPDGCPIFSFQYNDGGTDQLSNATEFIKGGKWAKITLDGKGVNGSYFDKLALNNSREELNTRTALGILGSVATIGVGALTGGIGAAAALPAWLATQANGVGEQNLQHAFMQGAVNNLSLKVAGLGIGASIASYAMATQRLNMQEEMLNARCITAVAPIQVGNSDFIRDTGMNKFYYVFTSYSGDDMWNFDSFLTRFGYNVGNMIIRNRHFYSRKRFVFVQVNELKCVANVHSYYQVGQEVMNKVEKQLKQGVTIWRCKPDAHYTLPDGNNIIEEKAYV